ncbi:hypothetical protein BCR34DRAFT_451434, partial [Clohesyomyces aquaticus]
TSNSSTNPSDAAQPISPVHRSGSFPHKTSPAVAPSRPFIETSTPAINDTPVELDGVPTSPKEVKRRDTNGKEGGEGVGVSPGLGEQGDIDEEFLGEGKEGVGKEVMAKRAAMLASRSKDPAVLVDLPQEPTAEEVEAAKSAEGTVTPGL